MRWPKPSDYRRPYETRAERMLSKSQARDQLPRSLREGAFKLPKRRTQTSHTGHVALMADMGDKETNRIETIAAGTGTEAAAEAGTDAENGDPEIRRWSPRTTTSHEQGENMQGTKTGAGVETEAEVTMDDRGAMAGREVGVRKEPIGSAAGVGREIEGMRGIVGGLRASGGASAPRTDGGAEMPVRELSWVPIYVGSFASIYLAHE